GGRPSEDSARDESLRREIKRSLEAHVEVHANDVEVFVKDGFVSLTGIVGSDEDKASIEGLVESTDGVRDVVSLLTVDTASDLARSLSGQDDFIIQSPS